jgi:hypothetical protein
MTKRFPYIVLAAAFSLAASAAYYSVFGLSKLFSSQATAVIILASSLEISKLITASYLHQYWQQISKLMRIYLSTAVIVLMLITSMGIYGFLASSYQDTSNRLQNLETVVANLKSKQTRFQTQLDAVSNEKQSVDENVIKLTTALSTNQIRYRDRNGNEIVKTDASNRKAYEKQLDISVERLNNLSNRETILLDSITAIDLKITDLQTTSDVAAEIGPLKYVSKITGKSMDTVVNWLIILLIIVFDPLAVILLISANKILYTKQPNVVINDQPLVENKIKEEIQKTDVAVKPAETNSNTSQILSYWNKIRSDREKNRKK